ncbi:hypothetical protein QJQ45_021247 [Haematococcus lacustris]|nr:hypothetical protein QJQ45_021247 [Haematococcus lacustris]
MRQVFQPWSWRYALLLLLCATACAEAHLLALNLTVPSSFQGSDSESYACTVLELPPTPQKLVGVVPLAEQSVVHHILLYGCQTPRLMPGPDGKAVAWECMHHSICDGPAEIIYGWGRNAPHLELPPGVAFSVGAGTAIRYVVAQVHYLGQRPKDDGSGVTLLLKPHAMPYSAGLIAYAAGFSIPPNTPSFKVENECCYQGHQPLTAFAFRVHTHVLGRQVFMTRQAWNHSGVESIASNNPQLPQAFYHIPQQRLLPGDSLKVTCDFDSTGRPTWTAAGSTHNDEMCNLYMMVYAPHPFIVMCNNAGFTVNEQTPGTMPRSASFQLDPAPFWQPPGSPSHPPPALVAAGAAGSSVGGQAAGAQAVAVLKAAGAEAEAQGRRLGDVSGVSLGPDGSVWALYR